MKGRIGLAILARKTDVLRQPEEYMARAPYRPPPRHPFSVRFREEERWRLEVAALKNRETIGEYVRRTALEAARRDLADEPVP